MGANYWDPAHELIIEEARRSIDRQSERLQAVRERAIGLVGFGSIVAAAFGFSDPASGGLVSLVALAAFVVVTASALYILIPREFYFELGATRMGEWLKDDPEITHMRHVYWRTARARRFRRLRASFVWWAILGLNQ